MPIQYFYEDIEFILESRTEISSWLETLISYHKYSVVELNYIFCSDEYLLQVNRDHLNHDYYTDIITFDNSEAPNTIESDIFISIDRVNENAKSFNNTASSELHRVMAHGLLHLFGFRDKTEQEKILMREKEDLCLSLLKL